MVSGSMAKLISMGQNIKVKFGFYLKILDTKGKRKRKRIRKNQKRIRIAFN